MKMLIRIAILSTGYGLCSPNLCQQEIDPTGWWRGTTETPVGEVSTTVRFDYVDGEFMGSLRNSIVSAQLLIHDGTLDGNKVAFKLQLLTRVLQYEGEIVGDDLTLSARVIEGEPFPGDLGSAPIRLIRSE